MASVATSFALHRFKARRMMPTVASQDEAKAVVEKRGFDLRPLLRTTPAGKL